MQYYNISFTEKLTKSPATLLNEVVLEKLVVAHVT